MPTDTPAPAPADRLPRDAWLLPILQQLLGADAARALQGAAEGSLWEAAVRMGATSDAAIVAELARRFRMKVADLSAVNPHVRDVVPEALARRHRVVPLAVTDAHLEVATADPTDVDAERALAFASGRAVRLLLAPPARIVERLEALYAQEPDAATAISRILDTVADRYEVQAVATEPEPPELGALVDAGSERPVIRLVDYVLAEGIASRASDIHLEPGEGEVAVRFRIDGVLRQVLALPRAAGVPLVSRVKIISGLDIADRLRPQDGRARVVVNGRAVDLRVSTLPAAHGEKVVVRILAGGGGAESFDDMGLHVDERARVARLLQVREGVVLVTGPTGSGKTTTLYTALREIHGRGGVNVVTVEDPVEYRLPGVVQVQVNEKAGLTFAAALRSILRQDPDVVLVGEIRDRETAAIAVQASLTGHLVLSTLHTLDAASSVTRLVDIGVESYKLGAALKGIIAQRLLRRLCAACRRRAATPVPAALLAWAAADAESYEPAGCAACAGTGYRGRVPVMEVLLVDGDVERRISAGDAAGRIVEAARAAGMRSLWESGVAHVLAGTTSFAELQRVLDAPIAHPSPQPRSHPHPHSAAASPAAGAELPRRLRPRILPLPATRPVHRSVCTGPGDSGGRAMSELRVGVVDVFVVRPLADGWRVLVLRRAPEVRCPGAWEVVHGSIEPGERPPEAAVREVHEETGLAVVRLYNVTAHPFYLHKLDVVQIAVVFVAFVDEPAAVTVAEEHSAAEWLTMVEAEERLLWPRTRANLRDAHALLREGHGGAAEDVLRVV